MNMNEKTIQKISNIIQETSISISEKAYKLGISPTMERSICDDAAKKIIKYLTKRCEKEARLQTGCTPTIGYRL